MTMRGRVALVTGASSGLGEALALELSGRGSSSVLAARRADKLASIASACEEAGGTPAGPVVEEGPKRLRHLARKVDQDVNLGVVVLATHLCAVDEVRSVQLRDVAVIAVGPRASRDLTRARTVKSRPEQRKIPAPERERATR